MTSAKYKKKPADAKDVDRTVCPHHPDRKLVPTRTTAQLVCPVQECDYWRQK